MTLFPELWGNFVASDSVLVTVGTETVYAGWQSITTIPEPQLLFRTTQKTCKKLQLCNICVEQKMQVKLHLQLFCNTVSNV